MLSSQTIEHIVLFKLKDTATRSDADNIINRINGLKSINQVLHLTAGPLLAVRSSLSSSLTFNLMLHARYRSKQDLFAYNVHPHHIGTVDENRPFVDDIMAVDWMVEDLIGPLAPPPGSSLRLTCFKLKDNLGEDAKLNILEGINGNKYKFGEFVQFTCGENFSPERAKGFSVACLVVYPSLKEMEAAESNSDLLNYMDKFKDCFEDVLVLDHVVQLNRSV